MAARPVAMGAVQSYIKCSRGHITHATLHQFKHQKRGVLKYVTTHCKNLTSLVVSTGFGAALLLEVVPFAKNLTALVMTEGWDIAMDIVSLILVRCSKLKRAEFRSISQGRSRNLWASDMKGIQKLTLKPARKGQLLHTVCSKS